MFGRMCRQMMQVPHELPSIYGEHILSMEQTFCL